MASSSSNGTSSGSSSYRWPGPNSPISVFLDTLSPEAQQIAKFLQFSNPHLLLVPTPTTASHAVLSSNFPSINLPLRDFLTQQGIKVVTLEWLQESVRKGVTLPAEGFALGGEGAGGGGGQGDKGKGKAVVRERTVSVELLEDEDDDEVIVVSSSFKRGRVVEDEDELDDEDPASSKRNKVSSSNDHGRAGSSSTASPSKSARKPFSSAESVDFCDLMAHYSWLSMAEKLQMFCKEHPSRTPNAVSKWYYDNRQLLDTEVLELMKSLPDEALRAPASSSSSKTVDGLKFGPGIAPPWSVEEDETISRMLAERGNRPKQSVYDEFSRTSGRTPSAASKRLSSHREYYGKLIKRFTPKSTLRPPPPSSVSVESPRKQHGEPVAGPSRSSALNEALHRLHEPVAGPSNPKPNTPSSIALASALSMLHEPIPPPPAPAPSNPLADALRLLHEPAVPPPPPGSTSSLGSYSSLDIKPNISSSSLSSHESIDVKPRIPFHSNSNSHTASFFSSNPFCRHSTIDRSASPSYNSHAPTNAVASGSGSNPNPNPNPNPSSSSSHLPTTNALNLGAPPPSCPPNTKFCYFCSETQSRGGFEWIEIEEPSSPAQTANSSTSSRRKERACRFCATWMRETMSVTELVENGGGDGVWEEELEMSLEEGTRLLMERGRELRRERFGGATG